MQPEEKKTHYICENNNNTDNRNHGRQKNDIIKVSKKQTDEEVNNCPLEFYTQRQYSSK